MVNKSKFNCLQCLKSFHSKYSLEIHTDSQHEGVVNRCKICDAPIRDIRNMTEHEQSMHGDKSFQCEKCKLIFNTKKKLRDISGLFMMKRNSNVHIVILNLDSNLVLTHT